MVRKTQYVFVRRTHGFGGVENRLIDWLSKVDYEKADVTIITHVDVFSNRFDELNVPVKVVTTTLGKEFSFQNIKLWLELLKKHRPDAIVFMQGDFFDIPWFLLVIGKIIRVKKIYLTEHLAVQDPPVKNRRFYFNVIPGLNLWWYRKVYSNGVRGYLANKVLAVSEGVKGKLILWKYPPDNIVVVKHGVDVNLFCPSSKGRNKFRKEHDIPANAKVIISTARFEKQKRLERIVYSFNKLYEEHENLWLLFIGEGSLLNQVRDQVVCKKRVLFPGFMERKMIPEALQGSDIFVLPSDNEGFGTALIEAMSTGLICIATKVPGPEDILQDGVNGFLAGTNQEDIHGALRKVLAFDDREKMEISANARKTVEMKYQKDIVIKGILSDIGVPCIAGIDR